MTGRQWRGTVWALPLVVAVDLANSALARSPETHVYMLPGGLLAGITVAAPRRWRLPVALLGGVVAALPLLVLLDHPLNTALLVLGLALSGYVVAQVLDPDEWPGDRQAVVEVLKFGASCLVGATLAGVAAGVVELALPAGVQWWRAAIGTVVAQFLHLIVIVPLFLPAVRGQARPVSRWFEREVRWGVLLAVLALTLSPVELPNAAMLLLPILVWTALRAAMWEICLQTVCVYVAVTVSTSRNPDSLAVVTGGHTDGPFAAIAPRLFVLSCAIATIPFAIMVALERRSAARARSALTWNTRLLESVQGTCIIGIDTTGRIESFNPGAERVLGYRADDLRGRDPAMFHSAAEIQRLAERFGCAPTHTAVVAAVREQSRHGAVDIEYLHADGGSRILSTVLQPVIGIDSRLLGWVATAEDVTERVLAQTALEDALRIESNAAERLRGVERAKDTFVSAVSHEIRTPVTNIVGFLEMLVDGDYGEVSGPQRDVLVRMAQNSDRLLELIDDLLTLSSLDSLVGSMTREEVDLRDVVRSAEEIFTPAMRGRELSLAVDVPEEPVWIVGDPRLLERMVTNLAGNAIKFTPDGGSVSVSLSETPDTWTIAVTDTGIGIPEEEQELLFRRFYRATTALDAAVQGSGLGLNIALTIAELHGATIEVDSVVGTGTTFRVRRSGLSLG